MANLSENVDNGTKIAEARGIEVFIEGMQTRVRRMRTTRWRRRSSIWRCEYQR